MELYQVIVLAFIQGLTEFLPVSSSAHLILPSQLFGWPDQGLAFDISVHVGTLLAVLIYFRKELVFMFSELWGWLFRGTGLGSYTKIFLCVLLGTIPVGLAGLCFKSLIEEYLRSEYVIAATTIFFGILLLVAERYNKKHYIQNPNIDLEEEPNNKVSGRLSALKDHNVLKAFGTALLIGCAQAVALIPGTSRSGITLTMGYFLKMHPSTAARFSFLLSIPVIILSGLLGAKDLIEDTGVEEVDVSFVDVGLGIAISFVTALLVIKLFLKFLNSFGLLPYVIYRVILGIVLIVVITL